MAIYKKKPNNGHQSQQKVATIFTILFTLWETCRITAGKLRAFDPKRRFTIFYSEAIYQMQTSWNHHLAYFQLGTAGLFQIKNLCCFPVLRQFDPKLC